MSVPRPRSLFSPFMEKKWRQDVTSEIETRLVHSPSHATNPESTLTWCFISFTEEKSPLSREDLFWSPHAPAALRECSFYGKRPKLIKTERSYIRWRANREGSESSCRARNNEVRCVRSCVRAHNACRARRAPHVSDARDASPDSFTGASFTPVALWVVRRRRNGSFIGKPDK